MTRFAKRMVLFAPTICITLALVAIASAQTPFEGQAEPQRDIVWLYDSPLTVYEEITDLGNGIFEYYFSFENVDEKRIWHFGVYPVFDILSSPTTWDLHHETWSTIFENDLDTINPSVYDARNLNPDIAAICSTFGGIWPDNPNPIYPAESVQGFTFLASTYDNSPKLYFYETVEDGWASNTGLVAAIGFTQPEPVSLESTSWSGVKALYR
jgi:hypothetical protein